MCQQPHISYHEAKYVFQFTQKLDMKWEKHKRENAKSQHLRPIYVNAGARTRIAVAAKKPFHTEGNPGSREGGEAA